MSNGGNHVCVLLLGIPVSAYLLIFYRNYLVVERNDKFHWDVVVPCVYHVQFGTKAKIITFRKSERYNWCPRAHSDNPKDVPFCTTRLPRLLFTLCYPLCLWSLKNVKNRVVWPFVHVTRCVCFISKSFASPNRDKKKTKLTYILHNKHYNIMNANTG